jgi:hypothetical protein
MMLTPIADNIWYVQHPLVVGGVPITSRMTVVRLRDGTLWIHSPVLISAELKEQIDRLGQVRHVVAPNLAHHLFVKKFAANYPEATVYGAPGLAAKRPDIANLHTLNPAENAWAPELEFLLFEGLPMVNETVWFHKPSSTLILTDLCQHWQGPMEWKARVWAMLSGVRSQLDVPLLVRLLTRNKAAARVSANAILSWPFTRVVVAHNAVIEDGAKEKVRFAFRRF